MHGHAPFDDAALLALWEAALGRDAWQREELLVLAATDGAAPRTPGARNEALLRWRQQLLGRTLPLRATCPRCAGELDLALDTEALCAVQAGAAPDAALLQLGERRLRLRPPTIDDLRELSSRHTDAETLATALLERCVSADPTPLQPGSPPPLDERERAAVAARLEALDPCASFDIALACPDCGHAWHGQLDVAGTVWAELRRRAEQLLLDVAVLAREFAWSERDVLAMTPTRRAAYLQLAGAA
jgi:hypothetical protein